MSGSRDRDLVLAPNEFAFISDQTKGNINVYVGPYKTSLANTDQPVLFEQNSKCFEDCSLEESKHLFPTAPKGWYVVIKNPSLDNNPPKTGTVSNLTELKVGHKVNIPGPISFAMWPGQMSKIIKGHQLQSNQYLVVRVYDEVAAKENFGEAVIEATDESKEVFDPNALTMGKNMIIIGTDVSFYIPPTGIEVVPDARGQYVRDAVTLERLEYCILLNEDGNKRYISGPSVVFPNPTENFVTIHGERKFKAKELNEISGIYIKVIEPYTQGDKTYQVGDELFITGKEQMIYFPRREHAIIRYGHQEIHYSVAIPEGEGRYVMNRLTGQIRLEKGPAVFLPDPRKEVIIRRVLEPSQVSMWFPGNTEAVQYNQHLKSMLSARRDQHLIAESKNQDITKPSSPKKSRSRLNTDSVHRQTKFTPPRTITLDTKYDGVVTISIWTGYAILVVSKSGDRKVVVGPTTHLLEYDETLEYMTLSTGTPKSDANTIRSVYLRVLHNKVSDQIHVETKDLCNVTINLSYRVNFTGDNTKWFNVENYVKFLTEHMRSILRNAVKQYGIQEFYSNSINILRDTILGTQKENEERKGRIFTENGMHVYDVEILGIKLGDETIEDLLVDAQHAVVNQTLALESEQRKYELAQKTETLRQQIQKLSTQTKIVELEMDLQRIQKEHELRLIELQSQAEEQQKQLQSKLKEQEALTLLNESELARKKKSSEFSLEIDRSRTEIKKEALEAEVSAMARRAEAITPDLIAALQSFGDQAMVEKVAESMAPLAILGGESVSDIISRLLKGTVLENALKKPSSDT